MNKVLIILFLIISIGLISGCSGDMPSKDSQTAFCETHHGTLKGNDFLKEYYCEVNNEDGTRTVKTISYTNSTDIYFN